jgi:hypothetical protein
MICPAVSVLASPVIFGLQAQLYGAGCIGPVDLAGILVAINLLDQTGFQQLTLAHKNGMRDFDDP